MPKKNKKQKISENNMQTKEMIAIKDKRQNNDNKEK